LVADIEGGRYDENRVLRRIFGPKGDEVKGEWRRLHNEELNGLYTQYFWGDKSRRMRWSGYVAYGGEERHIHGFSGEPCWKESTWKT
jgi:hypothetical protein